MVVFFSVEPGFYEDGSFGIRIENVLLVKPAVLEVMTDDYWRFSLDIFLSFIIVFIYLFIYFKSLLFFFEQNNFKNRGYLGFEPVTLVSMFIILPPCDEALAASTSHSQKPKLMMSIQWLPPREIVVKCFVNLPTQNK